ncbi:hypothetical protein FOZ60_014779 [Perkinsus olseni]|uniref:Glycosyl hydrolase family 30 beta sandwich domain-containing protein n=1 Tax=Perkinsus olseni TaxID=32597 RepID=A0A7J6N6Z4_PEROL|nr:hypothetical protein FOZ60_014779 [Perkinsus olseni]
MMKCRASLADETDQKVLGGEDMKREEIRLLEQNAQEAQGVLRKESPESISSRPRTGIGLLAEASAIDWVFREESGGSRKSKISSIKEHCSGSESSKSTMSSRQRSTVPSEGAGGPNHSRLKNWCYTHIHVTNSSELVLYRSFYTFSHISRFVIPGSKRIDLTVTGDNNGLLCSAFLSPDESNVIIVAMNYKINEATADMQLDIRLAGSSDSLYINVPSSSVVTAIIPV